jgi:hypothetical protein
MDCQLAEKRPDSFSRRRVPAVAFVTAILLLGPILAGTTLPSISDVVQGAAKLEHGRAVIHQRFRVRTIPDNASYQVVTFSCKIASSSGLTHQTPISAESELTWDGKTDKHHEEVGVDPKTTPDMVWRHHGIAASSSLGCTLEQECNRVVDATCRFDVKEGVALEVRWDLTATIIEKGGCRGSRSIVDVALIP